LTSGFEKALTPEEKAKLFAAIDYQADAPPTIYPKEYVENVVHFRLGALALMIVDDKFGADGKR
jgi:vacuolar protein sorting-associated protein 13A/C